MRSVDDFTLLIQGPLTSRVLEVIRDAMWERIVVSTWQPETALETQIAAEVQKEPRVNLILGFKDSKFVSNQVHANLRFQVATTLLGLRQVKTDFVIKIRSDEYFKFDSPELFTNASEQKIHFGNFIVRNWSYHPFHISDHFFFGDTRRITLAFEAITAGVNRAKYGEFLGHSWNVPESVIGLEVALAGREFDAVRRPPDNSLWAMFSETFAIFDLDQLSEKALVARRAGVGPVSNLRKFMWDPQAQLIDFQYFKHLRQMRPSGRLRVEMGKWFRYLLRRYAFAIAYSRK